MPAERVSMRQIREVLRLRFASELPQRAIAKSLGLSQGPVSGYLSRARAAGVSYAPVHDGHPRIFSVKRDACIEIARSQCDVGQP
jgi:predicted transcriptional regulator